jgi:hypothetical protein
MIRQQTLSTAQIVQAINTLPTRQRMLIAEQIIRNIRRETELSVEAVGRGSPPADTAMEKAAQYAVADYQTDPELTAFTALDAEDFYETR